MHSCPAVGFSSQVYGSEFSSNARFAPAEALNLSDKRIKLTVCDTPVEMLYARLALNG